MISIHFQCKNVQNTFYFYCSLIQLTCTVTLKRNDLGSDFPREQWKCVEFYFQTVVRTGQTCAVITNSPQSRWFCTAEARCVLSPREGWMVPSLCGSPYPQASLCSLHPGKCTLRESHWAGHSLSPDPLHHVSHQEHSQSNSCRQGRIITMCPKRKGEKTWVHTGKGASHSQGGVLWEPRTMEQQ